jgi:hypothetical protein
VALTGPGGGASRSFVSHVVARPMRVYIPRVAVRVLDAGVVVRLATEDEIKAVERARGGRDLLPEPAASYKYVEPERPLGEGDRYVVRQAFGEFVDGDATEPWVNYEQHGRQISVLDDATFELLKLADAAMAEDLVEDLLSDMRIAGLGVSRCALMSAPRRIELAAELNARLAPLQRG